MFIQLSKAIVNTSNIEFFTESNIQFTGGGGMNELYGNDYEKLRLALLPRSRKVTNDAPKPEYTDLFNRLHALTGGKGSAVFNQSREKKLKDLLTKHRMTEDLLIRAATNIGNDPFLQGDNDNKKRYGDIDYLLRPDKAAKWSEELTQKKKGMFQ